MKTHPVVPSAKIFDVELKKDAAEFEALLQREKEIDDKIAEESQQGEKLLAAYAKCEDAKIDTSMCPGGLHNINVLPYISMVFGTALNKITSNSF